MPWLKFSRATSIPDSTRALTCSGELVAGPRVQTILARRDMRITLVLRRNSGLRNPGRHPRVGGCPPGPGVVDGGPSAAPRRERARGEEDRPRPEAHPERARGEEDRPRPEAHPSVRGVSLGTGPSPSGGPPSSG